MGALIFVYRVRTTPPNPPDTVTYSQGGLDIKISYSRPFKRGRVIFGEVAKALVPFGEYWRLGANAATEITLSKAVQVAGKPAGRWQLSHVRHPGATMWKLIFNSGSASSAFGNPTATKTC